MEKTETNTDPEVGISDLPSPVLTQVVAFVQTSCAQTLHTRQTHPSHKIAKHLPTPQDVLWLASTSHYMSTACHQPSVWQTQLQRRHWATPSFPPVPVLKDPYSLYRWRYQAAGNLQACSPLRTYASDPAHQHGTFISSIMINRAHHVTASACGDEVKVWYADPRVRRGVGTPSNNPHDISTGTCTVACCTIWALFPCAPQ